MKYQIYPKERRQLFPFAGVAWWIFVLISFPQSAKPALLPPGYLDAVVALGTMVASPPSGTTGGITPPPAWMTEGTGFFFGYPVSGESDPSRQTYEVYLVTARHVIEEHAKTPSNDILVRVNSNDPGMAAEFSLPIRPPSGQSGWFFGLNGIDVAAIRVNFPMLQTLGFRVRRMDGDEEHSATRGQMSNLGVSAGDGVFVLGFPMNMAGEQRNYVIVRQGSIARVSEMLDGVSNTYLIDSFVFPGNSGGPVILRPEMTSIAGTRSTPRARLIGIVVAYKPYSDVAVSRQTGHPRVSFEENSGLADVVPIDYVLEAIHAWRAQQPQLAPVDPTSTNPPSRSSGTAK